jgi:tetratricopeptide (TPR) repeat protein
MRTTSPAADQSSKSSAAERLAGQSDAPAAGTPAAAAADAAPRRRRAWKLALFSLLPLVLLLFAIELVLRLVGFGGSVALVVPVVCDDGSRVYQLNPEARQRFFFRQPRNVRIAGNATYRETFAYQKPPDTKRVFIVGASAALGYPYEHNVSFATYVQSILERRYPRTRFEVINAGITAISSYAVLDNVRELVGYGPDLLIIYAGHNEFYGTYAPTSAVGSWRWRPAVLAWMRFQRTKTYLLLKRLSEQWPAGGSKGGAPPTRAALIATMPRDEQIRLEGPLHKTVERNYERNLEAMIAAARRRHVPVVLCTLAVNEADCAPLRSWHRPDLSDADRAAFQKQFDAGRQALRDGATSRAIEVLDGCVRLDPTFADAHFLLARAFEKAGAAHAPAARRHYALACDHDSMHFRACSRFNAIIRGVAERERRNRTALALADVEGIVRGESSRPAIGLDLVIDHVHLRARAIHLAAAEMIRAAEADDLLQLGPAPPAPVPSFAVCNEDTGFSALDELRVSRMMVDLIGGYPFDKMLTRDEVLDRLRAEIQDAERALDPVARAAYEAWKADRSAILHNVAANAYFQAGRFTESAREMNAQLRAEDAYDDMTVGFLFHLYMCQSRRTDLAAGARQKAMDDIFARAVDLHRKYQSRPRRQIWLQHLFLGKFYLARNQPADAIPLLEKALALDPNNEDTLEHLLQARIAAQRFDRIEDLARRLRVINPTNALAARILDPADPRQKPVSP